MNKKFITFAILFFIVILIFYFNGTKQLYENDKESITSVIKSIEGYGNKLIEILEIKDFNDIRVAAFLSNNSPAYIQFYKNKDGNYK